MFDIGNIIRPMNWLDPITIILAGIGLGALACQLIIRLVDSYSGTDQKKDRDR